MPPRTRGTKTTKSLKENIGVVEKTKQKASNKVSKPVRKALADKTNSASDDNTSFDGPKELLNKTSVTNKPKTLPPENEVQNRPCRNRQLPTRFIGNQVLESLSSSKENTSIISVSNNKKSHISNNDSEVISPFKTPQKLSDTSLNIVRPKRVCRLPSRLEDHSISPSKFIPVEPSHASTPITKKKNVILNSEISKDQATSKSEQAKVASNKITNKGQKKVGSVREKKMVNNENSVVKSSCLDTIKKVTPDTNNNAKTRTLRARKPIPDPKQSPKETILNKSPIKSASPKKNQRIINKNSSYKVLDENKQNENQDVYEFTFDPNEEPPPQKKKRKVVRKKQTKPKTILWKNNYNQNINKALTVLKNIVAKKQVENVDEVKAQIPALIKPQTIPNDHQTKTTDINTNIPQIQRNIASKVIIRGVPPVNPNVAQNIQTPSIVNSAKETENKTNQVENITADFETSIAHDDFNYSPVNSPYRPQTPSAQINQTSNVSRGIHDPLNLKENLSFFDENPVASSSMNSSARHPHASPWRVEFGNLPIRWHVNSYVKPNMTPAMECSFVNFEEKKKHVYTNLVESGEPLPEIMGKDQPNLVQTSIISFIKEVVERNSNKKQKRGRSVTPVTASLFNDSTNEKSSNNSASANKTCKQLFTPQKNSDRVTRNMTSNSVKNTSNDKDNSSESSSGQKRKNNDGNTEVPPKTPRKEKDNTYFGFDDSENQEQENVSPKKSANGPKRALKPRARAVLKEINEQAGPTRAIVPVAAKTARKDEVERLYEKMKSASDAPVFPEKEAVNIEVRNVNKSLDEVSDDDSQSVHLFEDIEVVHHLKPQRKSYGKAKKVTFRQVSSDSDTGLANRESGNSDEEDNLDDLTFDPGVPFVEEKKTKKKPTKKQKMTKKEEEEAEHWAANFNSMCEDVEEFPLLVE